jgi:hypothetical protein
MYSRLLLLTLLIYVVSTCLAFGGMNMQSHSHVVRMPALYSTQCWTRKRTIRFNIFRKKDADDDNDNKQDDDSVKENVEIVKMTSNNNNNNNKSFAQTFNDFGQSLKDKATKYKTIRETTAAGKERFWLTIKICTFYMGYIVYRAYRGFFILLPAVFKQVYGKLESNVDSPFVDQPGTQDINPDTGKMRLRTRLTISILSAIITFTYVIGGTINVFTKFVKTLLSGSPIESFEAAAKEAQVYESKIRKMTRKEEDEEEDINDGKSSGLAP